MGVPRTWVIHTDTLLRFPCHTQPTSENHEGPYTPGKRFLVNPWGLPRADGRVHIRTLSPLAVRDTSTPPSQRSWPSQLKLSERKSQGRRWLFDVRTRWLSSNDGTFRSNQVWPVTGPGNCGSTLVFLTSSVWIVTSTFYSSFRTPVERHLVVKGTRLVHSLPGNLDRSLLFPWKMIPFSFSGPPLTNTDLDVLR